MATIFTLHIGFANAIDDAYSIDHNRGYLSTVLRVMGFTGYTILDGIGYYEGKREPSASVIFIASHEDEATHLKSRVIEAAKRYKNLANQEEVWLTIRQEELEII